METMRTGLVSPRRLAMWKRRTRLFAGIFLSCIFILTVTSHQDHRSRLFGKVPEKILSIIRYWTRPPYPVYDHRKNDSSLLGQFGLSGIHLLQTLPQLRPLYNFTLTPSFSVSSSWAPGAWYLLVMVKSRVGNLKHRTAIRKTWGGVKSLGRMRMETIFMLGSTEDESMQRRLVNENRIHGDLLQYHGSDGYDQLLDKILSGFQWSAKNLPRDWLVASADDDVTIHVDKLRNDIEKLMGGDVTTGSGTTTFARSMEDLPIFCAFQQILEPFVFRYNVNKWQISRDLYPVEYYPSYCGGAFYAMPLKTASRLYELSRKFPHFRIDDVWIAGVLRMVMQSEGDTKLRNIPDGPRAFSHGLSGPSEEMVWHIDQVDDVPAIVNMWKDWNGHFV